MMLVLVVVSAIVVMGMNLYRQSLQQADIAMVKTDVALVFEALTAYYAREGCNALGVASKPGEFRGAVFPAMPKWKKDLGLGKPSGNPPIVYKSRPPLVRNYKAAIVDTGETTYVGKKSNGSKKPGMHVYRLQVQVVLEPGLAASNSWYEQALNAGSRSGRTLTWSRLPDAASQVAADDYWVMDAPRQFMALHQSVGAAVCAGA